MGDNCLALSGWLVISSVHDCLANHGICSLLFVVFSVLCIEIRISTHWGGWASEMDILNVKLLSFRL